MGGRRFRGYEGYAWVHGDIMYIRTVRRGRPVLLRRKIKNKRR